MATKLAAQSAAAPVNVKAVESENLLDRIREVYESVARRAYEFFESRGREDGRDLEDWFRAERELLSPAPVEVTEYGDRFAVRAEVPGFSEKEIKVSVEPRRLFISGKLEQTSEKKEGEILYTEQRSNDIFRALDLPAEVDPAKAEATLKLGVLDITLPKLVTNEPASGQAKVE
jgi:HSP20 family protein